MALPVILVVDDETYMREMLKTFFEMHEYECHVASDGIEALELLKENHIDIIITDMKMPHMNGLDLLKTVKKDYANISAVIMTGFSEEYTTTEALNYGADGYITKPFRNKELLLILKRIQQIGEMEL
ncbi:MAG: response regulator [Candidatus Delongbacteria bacterium]|nr:response regulator [Candidatus Delongbacteria bacterium]MBN2834230.1 response regulator [Candidatus Delongbacteria bacterium]